MSQFSKWKPLRYVRLALTVNLLMTNLPRRSPSWCAPLRIRGENYLFSAGSRFTLVRGCRCSSYSLHHGLLFGGILGLFGLGREEEEEDGTAVPPSVKRQLLLAQRALKNGPNYDEAERAYHKALEMLATSQYSSRQAYQEARAVTLDKLANLYLEEGKLDLAEVAFKEAMRVMIAAGMKQTDDAIVEISLKLSKVYTNQKKYDLAGVGFQWCVSAARDNFRENETENSHALLGMCLHDKAHYHLVVGENSLAETALTEALEIGQQIYGNPHLQVAVLHNDLATAVDRLGQHTRAESLVRESIKMAESLQGSDVLENLVIFYCNQALIQSHKGLAATAAVEESFNKALKLAKKSGDRRLVEHVKSERNRCTSST